MKNEFSTKDFAWVNAEKWAEDYFWSGIFIAFSDDLKVFGCKCEDALAIICSSYRYGVAFEIYGVSKGIAGVPLGYFPDASLIKGPGKCIDKQWVLENWNDQFGFSLPKLGHVWFSSSRELSK
ncbi:hypothetical protein [Actimicrobium sp. CCI2.3]|uniref:hypothetical protein n=1 Tax=Actimicrobium sp. CCI2.3 TaxID=3048616 RepID=UPI002AB5C733|nr:hypothetical protein [Actimicrobium sp. CCI2.3]MDY7575715.1 hypothetical protein [Actimicrobium sp. CCI2.3]MEB0024143.1 hypothetical protein [Actimicrobium sp. CCI2.3]